MEEARQLPHVLESHRRAAFSRKSSSTEELTVSGSYSRPGAYFDRPRSRIMSTLWCGQPSVIDLEQASNDLHWMVAADTIAGQRTAADCQLLQEEQLADDIVISPHPQLHGLPWKVSDTIGNRHVLLVLKKHSFQHLKRHGGALALLLEVRNPFHVTRFRPVGKSFFVTGQVKRGPYNDCTAVLRIASTEGGRANQMWLPNISAGIIPTN